MCISPFRVSPSSAVRTRDRLIARLSRSRRRDSLSMFSPNSVALSASRSGRQDQQGLTWQNKMTRSTRPDHACRRLQAMATVVRTTREVLEHHLNAFGVGDLQGTLDDYT